MRGQRSAFNLMQTIQMKFTLFHREQTIQDMEYDINVMLAGKDAGQVKETYAFVEYAKSHFKAEDKQFSIDSLKECTDNIANHDEAYVV